MPEEPFATILNIAVIALALLSLGALFAWGALRERTLRLGPDRDLGLRKSEYVFGVTYVCGYVALMLVAGGLNDPLIASASMFVPLIVIGLMVGRAMNTEAGFRKLGLAPRHPWRDLGWAAVGVPVAVAFAWSAGQGMSTLSEWLGWPVSPIGHESLKQLIQRESNADIVGIVVTAVLIAPLLEEAVFRGVLQTSLLRLLGGRRWPTLLIAAALFSVTHAWVVPWQNLVPLFVLGLIFGYLYERTGSLLTPVLTHAGFNAINIAVVLATN